MSNDSPSDIITYIGVPLAVLGVLPILYNTVVTIAALSRIRRILRSARLTALTRSDIVNRTIEVDLPRYAVTPHHRSHPLTSRSAYWSLSPHPSAVPGGSWTVFNWRTTTVGLRTQRIEYSDQLRQPQCEVEFEDLVSYLLDLGAIPDPRGWTLLRSAGLWTPVGCCLMRSPVGNGKALTIAPLDESDGHLSLAVAWSSDWTTRDHTSLPPYWVRLPVSTVGDSGHDADAKTDSKVKAEPAGASDVKGGEPSNKGLAAEAEISEAPTSGAIVCKFSDQGLVTAHHETAREENTAGPSGPSGPSSSTTTFGLNAAPSYEEDLPPPYVEGISINHLMTYPGATAGTWFASAATAYGTTAGTVLWSYRIPEPVISFCRKESLPCGVLEMLELVDSSATPEWRSTTAGEDSGLRNIELLNKRMREQRYEMEKESRMKPDERQRAVRERMQREGLQRLEDHKEQMRAHAQAREAQRLDAIHSSKWSPAQFAPHALRWLQQNEKTSRMFTLPTSGSSIGPDMSEPAAMPAIRPTSFTANPITTVVKPHLGPLLHALVLDPFLASAVISALDNWKHWCDKGGMRREDLDALMQNGNRHNDDDSGTEREAIQPAAALAMASLVAAVIGSIGDGNGAGGMGPPVEALLSADLRECLKMWPKVRLG